VNTKSWKLTLEAEARHEGLGYKTKVKNTVERQRVKMSCLYTCKLECKENDPENTRYSIYSKLWSR